VLNAKDSLTRLLAIQNLARQIRLATEEIDNAPARVEEIEGRFRERNIEYVALKDRYDEIEGDRRARDGELAELEESRKKFMADLMQVKNQREYAAMLKEIDVVKARIAEHEDAILKEMEEAEVLQPQLQEHAEHIEKERAAVKTEHDEVDAAVAAAKQRLEDARAERARIESELPEALRASLHRIEANRNGLFMARVEDGSCQACYVRVRPQVFHEIKQAAKVHFCSQCKRILYFGPALEPPPEESSESEADPSGVGAANGGSV
jgi:predicted  nucleic acid-binding Zn-ribbon protein